MSVSLLPVIAVGGLICEAVFWRGPVSNPETNGYHWR